MERTELARARNRKMVEFDYGELVKATESFSASRLVGKGSHGSVYKGVLEDDKLVVAIKKSTCGFEVFDDNLKKLDNEIGVLSSLREKPYIIKFLGTSHDSANGKSKLLVMEFMPNGSLHDLLHVADTPPSWPKRIEIAIQIARAVQVLHEGKPLVIHRDIKSDNVLFDSCWHPKLADFGLAVSLADSPSQLAIQPAGTIGYLDPYYTTPSKLSTKNDVFSFGVVLLEIISCKKAIDVCREPASIVEWALPLIEKQRVKEICDVRIELPTYMIGTIRHLLCIAARCLSAKEENRPSISEIIMGMETCLVERVRIIPTWSSLLRRLILIRPQQKSTAKWVKQKGDVQSDISKGQLLLREILADITIN